MRHVTDHDIQEMASGTFCPDTRAINRDVRRQLKLGTLIPPEPMPIPVETTIDLHNHTIEMAWERLNAVATSGVRRAIIITGASGILRQTFPQWATTSTLAPHIYSWTPINNGSFRVQFKRIKNQAG